MNTNRTSGRPSIDFNSSNSTPLRQPPLPPPSSSSSPIPNAASSPIILATPSTPSHRRSSSIASGISSIGGFNLSSQSPLPVGFNYSSNPSTLGSNSIAELVDGKGSRSTTAPFRAPTAKEIPPVTLTQIKKIKKTEFATYLNAVSTEYNDLFDSKATMRSRSVSRRNSELRLNELGSPIIADGDKSMSDATLYGRRSRELTPLSTIPAVFFEENFQLDNPRVFDLVSERSDIVRRDSAAAETGGESRKVLANNTILQERLTWYIDTVELHLINEISNASSSFFSALDDLKNVKRLAADCVAQIERLRRDLAVVDEKRAKTELANLHLSLRRKNVFILAQALEQVSILLAKSDEAEGFFVDDNNVTNCLDTIDAIESLLAGSTDHSKAKEWTLHFKYPVVDLRSVQGLSVLRENLRSLRSKAGETYAKVFATTLLEDLRKHHESVSHSDTLQRLAATRGAGTSVNQSYLDVSPELRKKLEIAFEGLARSDNVSMAFKSYREMVVREAKDVVRMNLPSQSDTSSMASSVTNRTVGDKSSALRNALISMTAEEAEKMVKDIYTSLAEVFRRLSTHQKLLLDITASSVSSNAVPVDMNDIVSNVVRLSISRMVKVLKARQAQVVNELTTQQFINYFILNHLFLTECENVCGETGDDLRSMMTFQIKSYIQTKHRTSIKELQAAMERDNWREFEISPNFQKCLDRLVKSSESTPQEWAEDAKQVFKSDEEREANDNEPIVASQKTLPKNVFVEQTSFIVPRGAVECILYVEDYLRLVTAMPHLCNEVAMHLGELLSKFNYNVNDLILQARAVRLEKAQLKHITAKHLSLAHESLNLVSTMIPYVRECLRRQQGILQTRLQELDSTKRAMQKLMSDICGKFVNLMSDRMENHSRAMLKIEWSVAPTGDANKYMTDLCKEAMVLVKIIRSILPHQTYLDITSRIFDNYKRKLLEQYTSVTFKNAEEKNNMLRDAEYFKNNLSQIEGAGNSAQVVWENVRAMPAPGEGEEPEEEPEAAAASEEPAPATAVDDAPATVATAETAAVETKEEPEKTVANGGDNQQDPGQTVHELRQTDTEGAAPPPPHEAASSSEESIVVQPTEAVESSESQDHAENGTAEEDPEKQPSNDTESS